MRSFLLAPCLLVAALQPAGQTPASALYGVWDGTLTSAQIGRCSINGVAGARQEVRIVSGPAIDKPHGAPDAAAGRHGIDDNLTRSA